MPNEFTCKKCGHSFNRLVASKGADVKCPRCGGDELETNCYLLGTADASELTFEDYCDVALAPCCTPDWKGWRNVFFSTNFCNTLPDPGVCKIEPEEEKEKQPEK